MRLIDADALCEKIRKKYDGYMLDEGCTPIEFENFVDEQPTAYDISKVVAELDNAESVKIFGSLNSGNRLIPVSDAIDIVRKGGVE